MTYTLRRTWTCEVCPCHVQNLDASRCHGPSAFQSPIFRFEAWLGEGKKEE